MSTLPALSPTTSTELPPDAVKRATSSARRDGVFAGLTAGLLAAIIGGRLMGLSRRKAWGAGIVAGAGSGYQFTQGFTAANVSRLRADVAAEAAKRRDEARRISEA
ncbi:hypothetical protein FA95DRAFT_1560859 [Auriscalpium vulgare]|uniref:Uncharacterized protein n=1 Tax=Auriscalpium vulgare TaxID=40419 RepID=A0ACB8RP88_9AGAM|nr:hypothetical protein FA95DRAFT_1560859 [Auriscalpium vulgare]